jgi:MFS family permease
MADRIWNTTFSSLEEKEYSWFFGGHILATTGMQMQFILFGYLAFDLTGSPSALGVVGLAGALSTLLIGPLGGAFADRVDKRYLIAFAQAGAATSMAIVAVLTLTAVVELWHLFGISLLNGILMSLNMPARQAIVPLLVPRHKLMNAISLQMGGMNLTSIVAPAMAGFLIDPLGTGWVFALGSVLYLASTWAMLRLPHHGMVVERKQRAVLTEMKEGFRYVWHEPTLRTLILLNMLIPILFFPARQLLPVFATDVFDRGPSGLGMLAAISGIGGLSAALLSANLSNAPRKGLLMLVGGLMMTGFAGLFALTPAFELAAIWLAVSAAGQMLLMNTANAVIQAVLPTEMRGRVSAMTMMAFGISPFAVLPVAVAADTFGAPATIAVYSVLGLGLILLLFAASPRLRGLRQDALQRAELSEVQAAARVASGQMTREQAAAMTGPAAGNP